MMSELGGKSAKWFLFRGYFATEMICQTLREKTDNTQDFTTAKILEILFRVKCVRPPEQLR